MEHCKILFKIIDTGIGIPTEKQSLLFTSFSQVDISNRRKYGGTGLGLAISKKLCELMNGSISLKSKPNWGTVFSFSIKAGITIETIPIEKIVSNQLKPLSTDKISLEVLIVEDNFVNQKLLSKLLKKLNVASVIANHGKEAIEILKLKKFPLIFMDIQMPELDGMETTKIIREEMKDNDTIIIALTANAMSGDREKYLQAGMNDYVSKPIDFSTIKDKLEYFLFSV
jgi:CheY-like chemotaxis protein